MKAYPEDLGLKVLAAVDRGTPRAAVVEASAVSSATAKRWLKKRRETGGVDPEPTPGPPAPKREALLGALPARARANPDLTLAEHRELFEAAHGAGGSAATAATRSGLTPQAHHRRCVAKFQAYNPWMRP